MGGFLFAAMTACSGDNGPISAGTNTGGGAAAGDGGNTGGTAGGSSTFRIDKSGYIVSGQWKGYAFVYAGTKTAGAPASTVATVPPCTGTGADGGPEVNFSCIEAGATQLCIQGSIAGVSDYSGVAMIGVNVNQGNIADDAGNNPQGTIAIGGTGITVTYTNPAKSVMRLQIQGVGGDTPGTGGATARWCATLSGNGGTETVTWAQFYGGVSDTTQGCWNSGGNNPAVGTEITQVSLLVPGDDVDAVPFDFCLQSIGQVG